MSDVLTVQLRADGQGLIGTLQITEREARRLQKAFDGVERTAKSSGRTMGKTGQATDRLRDSTGRFVSTQDAANKSSGRFGKSIGSLGSQSDSAARSVGRLVKSAALLIGVTSVAAGFAGAVRSIADFDQAMTESLAIMGDVSDAMRDDMTQAARQMALETKFSATDAAESYFFLASAGLNARQSVAALPQVAKFAQAGMFDMARATDLATDAQSALRLTSDDTAKNLKNLTRVTDTLVGANTLANASVEQFAEALTNRAGSAMAQLNIEVESGVAVLAAWADQGVKGVRAGEQFNIVTRDLQRAARDNREEFEAYNVAVFDAQGNFRNLGDILADLEGALGSMSVEQQGATLSQLGFQEESVQSIRQLIGLSEQVREYEADLRDMGGITEEVADKQLRSLTARFGLLKSAVTDLVLESGEQGLTGALIELTDATTEFVRSEQLSGALMTIVRAVIILREALLGVGELLLGLGVTAAAAMKAAIEPTIIAVTALGAATKALVQRDFAAAKEALAGIGGDMAEAFREAQELAEQGLGFTGESLEQRVKTVMESMDRYVATASEAEEQTAATGDAADVAGEQIGGMGRPTQEATKAVAAFVEDLEDQLDAIRRGRAEFEGGRKGLLDYELQMLEAAGATEEQLETLRPLVALIIQEADALDEAREARAAEQRERERMERQATRAKRDLDALIEGLRNEATAAGMSREELEQLNVEREVERLLLEQGIDLTARMAQERLAEARALVEQRQEEELAAQVRREAAEAYQRQWMDAIGVVTDAFGDMLAGQIKSFSDFAKRIRDGFRRMLADMIAQAMQAQIMRWLFGGGMGMGGMNMAMGAQMPGQPAVFGMPGMGGGIGFPGMGGMGGGMNQAMPWMMALTAGMYGAQGRHGTGESVAAGLTYGTAGFAAGTGMLAGSAALAGGAGMGTAAMAGMAAVPVIGWVALAAAALDMLTGGGLFGTDWGVTGSRGIVDVGEEPSGFFEIDEKRKKSLFRGTKRRTRVEENEELYNAALEIAEVIQAGLSEAARRLGVEVPEIVAGEFVSEFNKKGELERQFSRIRGVEYEEDQDAFVNRLMAENIIAVVDTFWGGLEDAARNSDPATAADAIIDSIGRGVAGRTQGLIRDVIGDVLPEDGTGPGGERGDGAARDVGGEASQIAERWRHDAELLLQGAQFLLAATQDVQAGVSLLDEGASLTQITDFVEELARSGETLLQTYARLHQQVGQLETALRLMSVELDKGRESLVRYADDIALAAGSTERANQLWANFLGNFFSPEELLGDQISQAEASRDELLRSIGYSGEVSAAAFRTAFEDAMAEGLSPEDVVAWLEAAEAISQVIGLEEELTRVRQQQVNFMQGIEDQIAELNVSPLRYELRLLRQELEANLAEARRLGLGEAELARVRQLYADQLEVLAQQTRASIADNLDTLLGRGRQRTNQLASAEQQLHQERLRQIEELRRAIQGVQEWIEGIQVGALSPGTPTEQLATAQSQFDNAIAAALEGDAQAAAQLPQLANQLLQLQAGYHGISNPEYQAAYDATMAAMQQVAGMEVADPESMQPPNAAQVSGIQSGVDELALSALEQAQLASQILDELGVLVRIGEGSAADLAEELDIPLRTIIEMVTGSLENNTIETARRLAEVAGTLDTSIEELATAIGVEVGSLADAQSAVAQLFTDAIGGLPPEFQEQLAPALQALQDATTDADASAALEALEQVTASLPVEYRDQLAPFFEAINISDAALEQVSLLSRIEQIATDELTAQQAMEATLEKVRSNLAASNTDAGLPAFATGGVVTRPMRGLVGEAGPEAIIPLNRFFGEVLPAGNSGVDPEQFERIIQRLERMEEALEIANDQRGGLVILTRDGNRSQGEWARQQIAEMRRANNTPRPQPALVRP